jgi:hypothetical protein
MNSTKCVKSRPVCRFLAVPARLKKPRNYRTRLCTEGGLCWRVLVTTRCALHDTRIQSMSVSSVAVYTSNNNQLTHSFQSVENCSPTPPTVEKKRRKEKTNHRINGADVLANNKMTIKHTHVSQSMQSQQLVAIVSPQVS